MRITKDPEERRLEILRAAEMLFSEKGFENTTVSDIVKKVGVAQGTFYYYFKSKEDALDAIVEEIIKELLEEIKGIAEDQSLNVKEKLEAIIDDGFRFQEKKRYFVNYIHTEEKIDVHDKVTKKLINYLIPLATGIVQQGIAEGLFHLEYPGETVEFLMAGMYWLGDIHDYLNEKEQYARKLGATERIIQRVLGINDEVMDYFRSCFAEKMKVIFMI